MRYTVIKSVVDVVGGIWMPPNAPGATRVVMNEYDIENAKDDDGNLTRESVREWLEKNLGDFQQIYDFRADIAIGDKDIVIDWNDEDWETMFYDCIGEDYGD